MLNTAQHLAKVSYACSARHERREPNCDGCNFLNELERTSEDLRRRRAALLKKLLARLTDKSVSIVEVK